MQDQTLALRKLSPIIIGTGADSLGTINKQILKEFNLADERAIIRKYGNTHTTRSYHLDSFLSKGHLLYY